VLAAILTAVPIVVALGVVLYALTRDRSDAPPVATMESGRSHMHEAREKRRAVKRSSR